MIRCWVLTVLPMFHVGGLNIQTTPALLAGAQVTLHARFDPAATLATIAEARPTLTVLVPATLQALLEAPGFAEKVRLLGAMDAYARDRDRRVRQVTASLAGSHQIVEILRADGTRFRDVRPLVRVTVSVVVGEGDRQESGSYGIGGREGFGAFGGCRMWEACHRGTALAHVPLDCDCDCAWY